MSIPGPSEIIQGNNISGYYGKVTGLINGNDLSIKTNITIGTLLVPGDITWLKFSHNGRILLIADRCIRNYIGWSHINAQNCVRGKVIDINGKKYLCRLVKCADVNPAPNLSGDNINDVNLIGPDSEWFNTIVKFTPNDVDSNWSGIYTWCQEIAGTLGNNVLIGYHSSRYYYKFAEANNITGWRPVLEVL